LQHHQIDQPRYACLAGRQRHRGGGVEKTVLDRIGEIDHRRALRSALDRADVEKIALDDFGAQRTQPLRPFVDRMDKGAHGNAAREQHFGHVPAGLALPAAGGGRDEDGFRHGFTSRI
jgi:hypothetical protein